MIEDEPESKYALRVWFINEHVVKGRLVVRDLQTDPVKLTPSVMFPGESITVSQEELPEFITQPIALLKMLHGGERVDDVGKRITKNVFYVFVRVEDWVQYTDDKTKEK